METMKLWSAALVLALPLAADFQPEKWKVRRPLAVTAGPGLAAVAVDRATYLSSQTGLGDLRVVRGAEEVPYLIESRTGSTESNPVRAEILDKAAGASGLSLVLAFEKLARHSEITVETRLRNFRYPATLETSENRQDWQLVKKGFLFDFSEEGKHFSSLAIAYPVSTRRYLRLRIEGIADPEAVTGVTAAEVIEEPAKYVAYGSCVPTSVESDRPRTSLHSCDLGVDGIPATRAVFEIADSDRARGFHRAAELEASMDGKVWSEFARGVLVKTEGQESLILLLTGNTGRTPRYWRARLYHRDDRPLTIQRIHFESVERVVKFERAQAGEYRLYFGNPEANTPAYDLSARLGSRRLEEAAATLGPSEPNPAYREPVPPPKPFSERYPWLLTSVLVLAVLGLGTVAVRFLKSAQG